MKQASLSMRGFLSAHNVACTLQTVDWSGGQKQINTKAFIPTLLYPIRQPEEHKACSLCLLNTAAANTDKVTIAKWSVNEHCSI